MLTAEQITEYREKGHVVPDYRLSDELLEGHCHVNSAREMV
jgi:hypothetical protein